MSETEMQDIYKSPEADLAIEKRGDDDVDFFAVSLTKLSVMYIFTFGLYLLVFFYQNWKIQKTKHELNVIPVLRAVFSIFFVHSLFSRMKGEAEKKGLETDVAFSALATVYVILSIAAWLLSNIPAEGVEFAIGYSVSLVLTLAILYPLRRVQKVVNLINDDERGEINSHYTGYNWLFIALGAVIWPFSLIGVYAAVLFPELQG